MHAIGNVPVTAWSVDMKVAVIIVSKRINSQFYLPSGNGFVNGGIERGTARVLDNDSTTEPGSPPRSFDIIYYYLLVYYLKFGLERICISKVCVNVWHGLPGFYSSKVFLNGSKTKWWQNQRLTR